ncbi:MAG TPA: F0F1 ATP synthase subunit epsilon [Dehalococcoidia bacterium]|nr:F0F1 ATP synthase subunit epsilon [Dehalococcoidia bacterium]
MPLKLQIVTPERVVFEESGVDSVTLPGSEGELTILPRHAPLMTALRPGALTFRRGGVETDVALSGGFLEVRDNKVIVLADTAERSDEIDIARAEEARRRAAARLATREDTIDVARAMAALERATARLKVIERRRRRAGGPPPPPPPPRPPV